MMDISDVRILIVADDPLARTGLAAMLANQPGYTVVGQVSGDVEILAEVELYQPDVILWDLGWDPAPSLDRLVDLGEVELPTVLLLPDPAQAADAWVSNVRGFLLRNTDANKLAAALSAAYQGLITIEPRLTDSLLPDIQAHPPTLVEALTPRELDVLQLLAKGLPNKTIALRLDISDHTVKFHVNAIMSKLNAQSRTEAVVRATQLGLILL